jgi:hypothetical protein
MGSATSSPSAPRWPGTPTICGATCWPANGIAQEEAFPGRCAENRDDLGSREVTARLARDLMRLAMLIERRYPPYSKWLGIAFTRLRCAPVLQPLLADALAATAWPQREDALCAAYEYLARAHNNLGLANPVEPTVRPFHDRPFRVLAADRFADTTRRAITDPQVSALRPHVGGVDQFVDSTDVLGAADRPTRSPPPHSTLRHPTECTGRSGTATQANAAVRGLPTGGH